MNKNICIYSIVNKQNGKRYIGQTINFISRKSEHFVSLRNGDHHSRHLQNAFNKYGENAFSIEVLEVCCIDELDQREQYWIDYFKTNNKKSGYNVRLDPSTNRGVKLTFSKEHIENLTNACRRGVTHYKFGTAIIVDRVCQKCQKQFQVSQARLQHVKALFCSKSCASKYRFLKT